MSKDLFWVEPPFLYTVATNSLHIKVHSLGCLLVVPHFSLTRLYVECVKVKVSLVPEISPYSKDTEGHQEVVGGPNDVLEHDKQEGMSVEGRHQFHQHHGERVGEQHHHHQHHQEG